MFTLTASARSRVTRDEIEAEASSVIHGFAAAYAVGTWALPNSTTYGVAMLTPFCFAMIDRLGYLFALHDDSGFGMLQMLSPVLADHIGSWLLGKLLALIPGRTNEAHAASSFFIVETVGWYVYSLYRSGKTLATADSGDIHQALQSAERNRASYRAYKSRLETLPPCVSSGYRNLAEQLADPCASDQQKIRIAQKLYALVGARTVE